MALTTHLRPMNFAQICFSPTEFLNGKSMAARDSTSLKDNVSKCQLLGLRSLPPESALSAICTGFMDLKGKTAWQGSAPGSGRRLSLALLHSGSCQGPCKLSRSGLLTPRGRGLLTRQGGGVVLPTWHHFDHLRKQTNKEKTKQQKCMPAADYLEGS